MAMKNIIVLGVCLLTVQFSFAQQAAAPEESYTLRERYGIMKSKAQSFKEYKVIKESSLDGVWKITRDSMAAKEVIIRKANQNIDTLNRQLARLNETVKQKEASMAEISHASTHITVLGMDLTKGLFITLVACIVGALLILLALIFGRMKLVNNSFHEKKLAINLITNEFEEYKRKAMEKQTKLSRELQDERNRLQARN